MTQLSPELVNRFRKKRFLFVIGQCAEMGGSERQAILLADVLKRQAQCDVQFLSWGGVGRVTDELAQLDIPLHEFPLTWNASRIVRFLELRRLSNFIRHEIEPQILLPYIGFNCKIIGLIWRKTGAEFTWWNQRDEGRDIFGSWAERRVIRDVPAVVSNSYEGRDFLVARFGLPPDTVSVLNNGVTLPEESQPGTSSWRERLGIANGGLLFTMVANLTIYKDHLTLLKAFKRCCESERRLHLAIAGMFHRTTQELKALAFDLGLGGKVHFLGPIDSVNDLLQATDVYVHSSYTEGCPNAVLEAMSNGLCVCGTDISGMRQAIGEAQADLLAPPKDDIALSKILLLLANDETKRKKIGRENRVRIAECFDPTILAESVLNLISSKASLECDKVPHQAAW